MDRDKKFKETPYREVNTTCLTCSHEVAQTDLLRGTSLCQIIQNSLDVMYANYPDCEHLDLVIATRSGRNAVR